MEAYAHLKTAEQLKEEGNGEFRAGRHAQAVAKYRAALKKKSLAAPLRATLLCNVAVCLVRLERWEEAVDAASDCLKGDAVAAKTRAKALLFRSRAFRGSPHRRDGGAAAAVKDLEAALALDPAQAALRRELADAQRAAPAAAAPARVAVTTGPRDDDVVGEARLLDDAALKGALKGKALYGADEQRRRYVAPPAAPAEPPREWVQARMKEALERKKAESGDPQPAKAYRATASGGVVPTWQRTPATAADAAAVDAFKLAAPELLPSDFAAPDAADFNRGYREVDVSVWCRRRLFARLRRLEARYADAGVRDGAAGVVRLTPSSVHGDALMVRVGERWDRAYDLGARFDFEARLGAPRTKDVVMKGKKQRVFMGVPTVRGAVVVRELTHVDGPDEALVELEWGYGTSEFHLEKDEVGLSKAHAAALRELLSPKATAANGVRAAVVDMLRGFVRDYEAEIPGEPRPKLDTISRDAHLDAVDAAVAADRARRGCDVDGAPAFAAVEPWVWQTPTKPSTQLDVDPNSKLAKLNGLDAAPDAPAAPRDDAPADESPSDPTDARGGFSHKMMEQFEALSKDGYTVLLGSEEPEAPPEAAARDPLDYDGKFGDVSDSDEELELPGDFEPPGDLGDDSKRLWGAIFKIAKGNPKECQRLMQNPDELQKHPEITALYEELDRP